MSWHVVCVKLIELHSAAPQTMWLKLYLHWLKKSLWYTLQLIWPLLRQINVSQSNTEDWLNVTFSLRASGYVTDEKASLVLIANTETKFKSVTLHFYAIGYTKFLCFFLMKQYFAETL